MASLYANCDQVNIYLLRNYIINFKLLLDLEVKNLFCFSIIISFQATLMEESAEESKKREEILKLYNACKEALSIISDVSMKTSYQPLPPPVKEDWAPADDSPG